MKKQRSWSHVCSNQIRLLISGLLFITILLFAFEALAYIGKCKFSESSVAAGWRLYKTTSVKWGKCVNGTQAGTYKKWYKNDSKSQMCDIDKTTSRSCTSGSSSQTYTSKSSAPIQTIGISYRQISSLESAISRAKNNGYFGFLGGVYPFLIYSAYMNYSGPAYTASSQAGVYDAGLLPGSVGVSTNLSTGSTIFSTNSTTASAAQSSKASAGSVGVSTILSPGSVNRSANSYYKPSALPQWDFDFSIQASVKESELELTPTLVRDSDIKSIAARFNGAKEDFFVHSRLYFSSLTGTGNSDGRDTESMGIVLMPGYTPLNQNENGLNLSFFALLELVSNDYGDEGSETRYVPGLGINISGITPLGGLQLSYLFSHDKNGDGEEELTGEDYFNINTLSLRYIIPLTKELIFSTRLSYLWILDMPDDMEDSTTELSVDLNYYGWKNFTAGLTYDYSIDGYESQGISLNIGYRW